MKESVFPDIDGAFTWYIATKDGLRGLRAAIQCGAAEHIWSAPRCKSHLTVQQKETLRPYIRRRDEVA
ncbi:hypothetical protein CKO42_26675 [Lamprobacter modestohalophilus]|uniref:Uncharacterized protein n=1 Tax=Lamprobacter modestohalophilus TaxID=1064514 RepID=A0A9X0WF42_9GAMM|nr:hypothetical protein [Lamprobacter modestohalophilus]